MSVKVIYIEPIRFLDKNVVKEHVLSLIYNTLLVNAYLSDDIEIYTDFNGMSIFSALPYNIKIINSNNLTDFKMCVQKKQTVKYLLLEYNQYLKPKNFVVGNYYDDNMKIKKELLNNINFDDVESYIIKNLYHTYDKLITRINYIIQ